MAVLQSVKTSMSVIPQACAHRNVPTQRGHMCVLAMMDTSWMLIRERAKLLVSSMFNTSFFLLSLITVIIYI